MAFADTLKRLRLSKGLTQEELANGTGLAKSSISMYESERRKPSFEVLEAFADFFNVDMNTLWETRPMEQSPASDDLPAVSPTGKKIDARTRRQLEKVLDDDNLTYNGVVLDGEDKEKVKKALELIFWDVKEKNKRKKD